MGDLVALVAVVEAQVGDGAAVGGDGGRGVGAAAVGERADLAVGDCDLVDLRVDRLVLPVLAAVGGEEEELPVRGPHRRAVVVEGAGGELARRAALGGHHEEMVEALLEEALAVGAEGDPGDDLGRLGPLGALGLLGHLGERRRLLGHQHDEGDRAPVRRPGDAARGAQELGELGGGAGVHPAHVELERVALARRVEEAAAVRRPARRELAAARGERPVVAAVGVDQPDPRAAAVLHHVHRVADVGHAAAVGGDLRVGGPLEAEDVHGLEAVEAGCAGAGGGARGGFGGRRRLGSRWRRGGLLGGGGGGDSRGEGKAGGEKSGEFHQASRTVARS